MCAILDASCVSEVFRRQRSEAGKAFFRWINEGRGRLSVGGKLRTELGNDERFAAWAESALLSGRVVSENDDEVDAWTERFSVHPEVTSNDAHVLALARVSKARLLVSNDRPLGSDFRNPRLINQPRGTVYPTTGQRTRRGGQPSSPGRLTSAHKQLLERFGRICRRWEKNRANS